MRTDESAQKIRHCRFFGGSADFSALVPKYMPNHVRFVRFFGSADFSALTRQNGAKGGSVCCLGSFLLQKNARMAASTLTFSSIEMAVFLAMSSMKMIVN